MAEKIIRIISLTGSPTINFEAFIYLVLCYSFGFCPLDFIGKNLSIWFEEFPNVEQLQFYYSDLNSLNFIGMETIKQILNIQSLNFIRCNIPEDDSLSQFLKRQEIKSIK
eukprot:snap_masked-scaffold_18-processed-gene-2.32-mRNA-1 protein AED:1.00 eAED:1.00 QI:0/0/0/0/1/1/3/0/109